MPGKVLSGAEALLLRLSLHQRIAVFVGGILVAVFVTFGYLGWEALDRSTKTAIDEQLATALMLAHHLDELNQHGLDHLSELAGELAGGDGVLDVPSASRALEQSRRQLRFFRNVLVVDPEGTPLASARPAIGAGFVGEAQDALDRVRRSGQPAISNLLPLPVDGSAGVLFVVPVARDGRLLGLVAGEIALPHPAISTPPAMLRLRPTGHLEVIDGNGRMLASIHEEDLRPDARYDQASNGRTRRLDSAAASEEIGQQTGHPDFYLPLLAARKSTAGRALYYEGEPHWHTMAFAPVPGAPWGVGLGQDERETLAALYEVRDQALALATGTLILALLLVWLGARSIVHPIQALTRAGERMATGDLSEPIGIVQPDEVGRLATVLDGMRQRLGQALAEITAWNGELEQRVGERTREQETTNRHLQALLRVATTASSGLDPQIVFKKALHELVVALEARYARGFLWSDQEHALRLVADFNVPEPLRRAASGSPAAPPCCALALREGAVLTQAQSFCPALSPSLRPLVGGTVCWSVPVRAGDRKLGVIALNVSGNRLLTRQETALLRGIAQQVAAAFENARLTHETAALGAARQMELLRSEFLAAVSHELRTPLGLIKGYTTLLRDDVRWHEAQQKEFLEVVDEECDRLAELVDSLLDTARAQAGHLQLHYQPVALADLVRRSINRTATLAASSHEIVFEPCSVPILIADQARLEQVVMNLLQNAVKYSPDGGPIAVTLDDHPDEVTVGVLDRGLGLPEAEMDRVFEPFYRATSGPAAEIGGAGLGLTVCQAIVTTHGGRIWAEPRPGGGTAVYFTLPRQQSRRGAEQADDRAVRVGRGR